MSQVEENQKGPIKDALASLITKENISKLIMLILTALTQKPVADADVIAAGPEVSALQSALENVPEDQRAGVVEECLQELRDEGRVSV